jgi:stearoyl-CoA desaturase (delta-9 desaturase)
LYGFFTLSFWDFVFITLGYTHVTIIAVTIYLHRNQAHRAIDLHPVISHFFRFWLWLTTGMNTKEWTAVHRKHHVSVETDNDPHSPVVLGVKNVLLRGTELYRLSAHDGEVVKQFGFGTPDDLIENKLYSAYPMVGILMMFLTNILLFGLPGVTITAIQMLWIPLFAAGVINGLGHWGGYRNFDTKDASTNIFPWGIIIGGEELHNNHHAFAASAKFSIRPWEFDIAWCYIRVLSFLKLATIKSIAPARPYIDLDKLSPDLETLKAVVANRLHVMSDFKKMVMHRVYREEITNSSGEKRFQLKKLRRVYKAPYKFLSSIDNYEMDEVYSISRKLHIVLSSYNSLEDLYRQRASDADVLLKRLKEWCEEAEQSGISALQEYVKVVRGYTLTELPN